MTEARHYLTLTEVTEHAHLSAETVIAIVDCGIIEPQGDQPQQWLFEPQMVQVINVPPGSSATWRWTGRRSLLRWT